MLSQPKHFCSNPGCQQWTWHSRKWPWVDRKNVSDDTIKVSTHTHIMYLYILIFKHNYTIYFSVYIYIYTYTRIHTSHNSTLYLPVWIYIYIYKYIYTSTHLREWTSQSKTQAHWDLLDKETFCTSQPLRYLAIHCHAGHPGCFLASWEMGMLLNISPGPASAELIQKSQLSPTRSANLSCSCQDAGQ